MFEPVEVLFSTQVGADLSITVADSTCNFGVGSKTFGGDDPHGETGLGFLGKRFAVGCEATKGSVSGRTSWGEKDGGN